MNIANIDVVILCGGLGKRLRSVVSGQPKVMANVKNEPFLDVLMEYVASFGFKRIILCTGYMRDYIKNYYENKKTSLDIVFSYEEEPLGTGGALKKARKLIGSNPFIVMNGDSICKVNLKNFIDFHMEREALLSIVLVRLKMAQDYGSITLDDSQRITGFNEKISGGSENLINAGIYLMDKDIFSMMVYKKKLSLEYDLFPSLIGKTCYGFITNVNLIDIGTPERYLKAKKFFLDKKI